MHVNSRRVLTSACAQHHDCSCSASSLAFSSAISLSRSAFCFIFLSVSLSKSLLALPKVGPPPDGKLRALKLPNAGGLPLLPLTPAPIRQDCAKLFDCTILGRMCFQGGIRQGEWLLQRINA
jgi:hypothetical protein